MQTFNILAFHLPFMDQSFFLLLIGLLLFGKRLPEVGKSLGQGIVQFKRGLKGIEDDVEQAASMPTSMPPSMPASPPVRVSTPVLTQSSPEHKYDPITGQPLKGQVAIPPGANSIHSPASHLPPSRSEMD